MEKRWWNITRSVKKWSVLRTKQKLQFKTVNLRSFVNAYTMSIHSELTLDYLLIVLETSLLPRSLHIKPFWGVLLRCWGGGSGSKSWWQTRQWSITLVWRQYLHLVVLFTDLWNMYFCRRVGFKQKRILQYLFTPPLSSRQLFSF